MGDKNLSFNAHLLTTTNPDNTGKSGRYGAQLGYFSDLLGGRLEFKETQENFNPAVGFIERVGIKEYDTFFRISPRPRNHPYIRRFQWNAGVTRTDDSRNVMAANGW